MKITRKSSLSGIEHTMEINVTPEQMHNFLNGMHIQKAMPNVPADHREFILTGITAEEWDDAFKGEEDEN